MIGQVFQTRKINSQNAGFSKTRIPQTQELDIMNIKLEVRVLNPKNCKNWPITSKKVQFSELHIHVKVSEGLLTRKDFAVKKSFLLFCWRLEKIGK